MNNGDDENMFNTMLGVNYADDDKQWRQKDQIWNFLQSGIASARSDKNVDGDPFWQFVCSTWKTHPSDFLKNPSCVLFSAFLQTG